MDIEKLWDEKRWLFFLLLPVVGVYAIAQFYEMWQVSQAEKSVKRAEAKEKKLQEKIQLNKEKIASKKEAIKQVKRKIAERRPNDVPLDWHENF